MKILVTGGCGFIGSHLANTLVEKEYEVTVLDNLASGKRERLNPKVEFNFGDIRNPSDIKKAIEGCSTVFHLAALTDLRALTEGEDRKVNFEGAENVFSIAQDTGARLIFTSSAAVYGNSETVEYAECKPLSYYGKNKLETEKICGEDSFIARLFNVYGSYGKSFVNTLCKKIPDNEEVDVYGNGSKTRDYIYVDDVVSALLLGLGQKGTYNVGTGIETSVLDLIKTVERVLEKKAKVNFAEDNKNEIRNSLADISKIRQLGWEPKTSLEKGIRKILKS
jgi:UDP-glucose 4-epimerase